MYCPSLSPTAPEAAVTTPSPPRPSDALQVTATPSLSETPPAEIAGVIGEAIALIRTYAPEYVPWVDRVVRTIVPIASPIETSVSRSVKGQHGIVYASFPSDAIHTAEVLVHEAAHQYFNILEHKHRMADLLSDDRVFFSPYVNKDRTIDRILFAYHAFANVLVFHRKCLAAGLAAHNYAYNPLAEQARLVGIIDGYLQQSRGLTGAGRAIYEPLRSAVG